MCIISTYVNIVFVTKTGAPSPFEWPLIMPCGSGGGDGGGGDGGGGGGGGGGDGGGGSGGGSGDGGGDGGGGSGGGGGDGGGGGGGGGGGRDGGGGGGGGGGDCGGLICNVCSYIHVWFTDKLSGFPWLAGLSDGTVSQLLVLAKLAYDGTNDDRLIFNDLGGTMETLGMM